MFMQKKVTFFQSLDSGGTIQYFFLAFLYFVWYVYCLL